MVVCTRWFNVLDYGQYQPEHIDGYPITLAVQTSLQYSPLVDPVQHSTGATWPSSPHAAETESVGICPSMGRQ